MSIENFPRGFVKYWIILNKYPTSSFTLLAVLCLMNGIQIKRRKSTFRQWIFTLFNVGDFSNKCQEENEVHGKSELCCTCYSSVKYIQLNRPSKDISRIFRYWQLILSFLLLYYSSVTVSHTHRVLTCPNWWHIYLEGSCGPSQEHSIYSHFIHQ